MHYFYTMQKPGIQYFYIALRAIKGQLLRTSLTVMIIAVGITALVGILTAIDAMKAGINKQFSSMGSNSFSIRNRADFNVNRGGKRRKRKPVISYAEAERFVERYEYPATVSLSTSVSFNSTIKYKTKKTNPNIQVFASDQHYLATNGFELQLGRNFNQNEIRSGSNVAIIADEVKNDLFENTSAIDKTISINNIKFRVVGVLEKKGSSMGFGGDRNVLIPMASGRQYFAFPNMNYTVTILTNGPEHLTPAINEAQGLFRTIRNDKLGREDSFAINRSDSLASVLIDNLEMVTLFATFIAFITLLGASIGLMNIMLVTVTERTREIGTRKAIGAKASSIRGQFLTEAILICQIGGVVGIAFGIGIGNLVSLFVGSTFIVPWLWIGLGIVVCFITGVVAGYYPAQKAASLDPIASLRYE